MDYAWIVPGLWKDACIMCGSWKDMYGFCVDYAKGLCLDYAWIMC